MRQVYNHNIGISYQDTDNNKPLIVSTEENTIKGLPYNNIFVSGKTRVAYGLEKMNINLYNLIRTQKGERVFLPDYGLNINNFLFEPNDFIFSDMIKLEIKQAVDTWLPNIILSDISVKAGQRTALITITYKVDKNATPIVFEFEIERDI